MSIQMIGIDHTKAQLLQRERYSFTKKQTKELIEKLIALPQVLGCVVLSTCNRLEIYISKHRKTEDVCLFEEIRILKKGETEDEAYFSYRKDAEAVAHLFYLCAGLKSRILGEDQILSQVKEALAFSREQEATDTVLEVLFRHGITAGKKVKSQVVMDKANFSAAHLAVQKLQEAGFDFEGKQALVIGNGMMGKVAALALLEVGAKVTVTVREYRSGIVDIPRGCLRINYSHRFELMKDCQIVCSATSSPNFTILKQDVLEKLPAFSEKKMFIDLAVPRDIDPSIMELSEILLYDIDDFSVDDLSKEMKEQYGQAKDILEEAISEYRSWYLSRDLVPKIHAISSTAAKDVELRLGKTLQQTVTSTKHQEELTRAIAQASSKVISNMLFSLRDEMEPEVFRNCIEILEEDKA